MGPFECYLVITSVVSVIAVACVVPVIAAAHGTTALPELENPPAGKQQDCRHGRRSAGQGSIDDGDGADEPRRGVVMVITMTVTTI